jgi:hypothetical protein
MGGTYAEPALASYRDVVTGLLGAGEPFGEVDDSIDRVADRSGQTQLARAHLATVG